MKRLLAMFVTCAATTASAEVPSGPTSSYVEPIAFEEVRPTEAGAWEVRARVVASPEVVGPSAALFLGISERLGADLDVPFVVRFGGDDPQRGVGDVGAGLTCLISEQSGRFPAVATHVEARLPTGDAARALGEGSPELGVSLGVASAGPRGTVQASLGFSTLTSGAERRLDGDVSFALALSRDVHLFGEAGDELELAASTHHVVAGPGLRYRIDAEVFVAAAILVGVTADTPSLAIAQVQHGF